MLAARLGRDQAVGGGGVHRHLAATLGIDQAVGGDGVHCHLAARLATNQAVGGGRVHRHQPLPTVVVLVSLQQNFTFVALSLFMSESRSSY